MSALAVRGLYKSFGGLHVTSAVSLAVEPGERRLIIGPNGAGKTTLFNLMTGELRPDRGTISLFGNDITRVPGRRTGARSASSATTSRACPAGGARISAWRARIRSSPSSRATRCSAT